MEKNIESIDFMKWGERCVRGQEASFRQMAQDIEEKYGELARMEFEVGVYNCIASYSVYSNIGLDGFIMCGSEDDRYIEQEQRSPKYFTEAEARRRK